MPRQVPHVAIVQYRFCQEGDTAPVVSTLWTSEMLLVLSFLLTPISLGFAIYRLIHIPQQIRSGQLRLDTGRSVMPAALAWAAYGVLLACTLALCAGVIRGWVVQLTDVAEIFRLVLYFEAYPIVYVLAEWRFFYGFPKARPAARGMGIRQEAHPALSR